MNADQLTTISGKDEGSLLRLDYAKMELYLAAELTRAGRGCGKPTARLLRILELMKQNQADVVLGGQTVQQHIERLQASRGPIPLGAGNRAQRRANKHRSV